MALVSLRERVSSSWAEGEGPRSTTQTTPTTASSSSKITVNSTSKIRDMTFPAVFCLISLYLNSSRGGMFSRKSFFATSSPTVLRARPKL